MFTPHLNCCLAQNLTSAPFSFAGVGDENWDIRPTASSAVSTRVHIYVNRVLEEKRGKHSPDGGSGDLRRYVTLVLLLFAYCLSAVRCTGTCVHTPQAEYTRVAPRGLCPHRQS